MRISNNFSFPNSAKNNRSKAQIPAFGMISPKAEEVIARNFPPLNKVPDWILNRLRKSDLAMLDLEKNRLFSFKILPLDFANSKLEESIMSLTEPVSSGIQGFYSANLVEATGGLHFESLNPNSLQEITDIYTVIHYTRIKDLVDYFEQKPGFPEINLSASKKELGWLKEQLTKDDFFRINNTWQKYQPDEDFLEISGAVDGYSKKQVKPLSSNDFIKSNFFENVFK